MSTQNRTPDRVSRGVPTGGQFAASVKGESGVSLGSQASGQPAEKPKTPAQQSYADLRRTGRVILSADERDSVLPALRRMAKAEGLKVSAMLSEPGRKNTRLSRAQLRDRPTYVSLVHPDRPTDIYAPDAHLPAERVTEQAAEEPGPLSAPPSTNPQASPFGNAATLEALQHHYYGLTSPENISWDGERDSTSLAAEYQRLGIAYWARRDEIDPQRERAYCEACRTEVAGTNGDPQPHDNDLGRRCWGSR